MMQTPVTECARQLPSQLGLSAFNAPQAINHSMLQSKSANADMNSDGEQLLLIFAILFLLMHNEASMKYVDELKESLSSGDVPLLFSVVCFALLVWRSKSTSNEKVSAILCTDTCLIVAIAIVIMLWPRALQMLGGEGISDVLTCIDIGTAMLSATLVVHLMRKHYKKAATPVMPAVVAI